MRKQATTVLGANALLFTRSARSYHVAMYKAARAGLIAVFTVSVIARVGWVVMHHGHAPDTLAYPDEHAYLLAAQSLAAGSGLMDEFGYRATYMPAYPAFIAVFERFGLSMMSLAPVPGGAGRTGCSGDVHVGGSMAAARAEHRACIRLQR